ncbi:hypothetical protein [Persicirhabdus sediminis]|uniref:Uncharacterized protein n=1 Tax=Persicirhabdus sediminis TaxID=454144 RepID=A0A8J7MCX5_9BACT|nr:hypothetical protein [Persicirhabdus sediminis]MBK1790213.1 hypothetical protein [Persicirhabdus sediminis]
MNFRWVSFAALSLLSPLHAASLEFLESWVYSEDREQALQQLVPGTADYYFFNALHLQLTGQNAKLETLMEEWGNKMHGNGSNLGNYEQWEVIRKRQYLFLYQKSPEEALHHIRGDLRIRTQHQRPIPPEEAKVPSVLSEDMISADAFLKHQTRQYQKLTGPLLYAELDKDEPIDYSKQSHLLKNLKRADHPKVIELILTELAAAPNSGFRSLYHINKYLTLAQLDELLEKRPQLIEDESFVDAYLTRMCPAEASWFLYHPAERMSWLEQAWEFAQPLPEKFYSLKAHLLGNLIMQKQAAGQYELETFLSYLAIPRDSNIFRSSPSGKNFRGSVGRLEKKFFDISQEHPAKEEDFLIHQLHHFIRNGVEPKQFSSYIEDDILRRETAIAHLLHGGPAEQWGKELRPEDYSQLREKTHILVAPENQKLWGEDELVSLNLLLKNTPKLHIKIFELDQLNASTTISADAPLSGLVPHYEKHIDYAQDPLIEHREKIELAELKGRGSWIVELIANKSTTRVMVQKGQLHLITKDAAHCQHAWLLDENRDIIPASAIYLHGKKYISDKNGLIQLPLAAIQEKAEITLFAANENAKNANSGLAVKSELDRASTRYNLHLSLISSREQMIAGKQATFKLRTIFAREDVPCDLSKLENPNFKVLATLTDGTISEISKRDIQLDNDGLISCKIHVPEATRRLSFRLSAELPKQLDHSSSTEKPARILQAKRSIRVNSSDGESHIVQPNFTYTTDGWKIELRGRNGEPISKRSVYLTFNHEFISEKVSYHLRSDENGLIHLGQLEGISGVHYNDSEQGVKTYLKPKDTLHIESASTYQISENKPLYITLDSPIAPEKVERAYFQFYQMDANEHNLVRKDVLEKIQLAGNRLKIEGLSAGTYHLRSPLLGRDVTIKVMKGKSQAGWICAEDKALELVEIPALNIDYKNDDQQTLQIQLEGHSPSSIVHLIGTRYFNHLDNYYYSRFQLPGSYSTQPFSWQGTISSSDGTISDEYRYIMERRASKIYPGNMLPRPSILLHRWDINRASYSAINESEAGTLEETPAPAKQKSRSRNSSSNSSQSGNTPYMPNYDYLNETAVVKSGLRPDASGKLSIDLSEFSSSQTLTVIFNDGDNTSIKSIPLAAKQLETRDLRLKKTLALDKHFMDTRGTAVLAAGAKTTIENMLDADWRAYTELADVYDYMVSNKNGSQIEKFEILLEWDRLTEDEKLTAWSVLASHEFNLFIHRHDPAWFERVIKPELANKMQREFIDDYLLGSDLSKYLSVNKFSQLNAAEMALLAHAQPAHKKFIVRYLSDEFASSHPRPEVETRYFTSALKHNALASKDRLGISKQKIALAAGKMLNADAELKTRTSLESIFIPIVDLQDVSLQEAIDFVNQEAAESFAYGNWQNISIDNSLASDLGTVRIPKLQLRNVPLGVCLQYICDLSRTRYQVVGHSAIVTPIGSLETDELYTRTFHVPPDYITKLASEVNSYDDPFASRPSAAAIAPRRTVKELLSEKGLSFPDGSNVIFDAVNGTLTVTNTLSNLDVTDQLTQSLRPGGPSSRKLLNNQHDEFNNYRKLDYFTSPSSGAEDAFASSAVADDPFASSAGSDTLYETSEIAPDRAEIETQVWAESQYFRREDTSHISANRYWIDYAKWDGKGEFISARFPECAGLTHSAMMALALCDLPASGNKPETTVANNQLTITAKSPLILFYRDTRETNKVADHSQLLARNSLYKLRDRSKTDKQGRKVNIPVTSPLQAGEAYTSSLTLTNPSDLPQEVEILQQIPQGAIALGESPATYSVKKEVPANQTIKLERHFYFPKTGEFPQYPTHILHNDEVQLTLPAEAWQVVDTPAQRDLTSWKSIAMYGSDEQVIAQLESANLNSLDLALTAWRMKDKAFYERAITILKQRLCYDGTLYSYAFLHGDEPAMQEYLEASGVLTNSVGSYIDTPIYHYDATSSEPLWHLEFDPIVNARQHRFQGETKISNDKVKEKYEQIIQDLSWKAELSARDQMILCYHLFLQDRVQEALALFDQLERDELDMQMQYDYLHCYALFYREDPQAAAKIAASWLDRTKQSISNRWQYNFGQVVGQAQQVSSQLAAEHNESRPEKLTAKLELEMKNSQLVVHHRGLKSAELKLYHIDMEALFSENPFLDQQSTMQPAIRPNYVKTIQLDQQVQEQTIELPESYRSGSLIAVAEAAGLKTTRALNNNSLQIQRRKFSQSLHISKTNDGKSLSKCYVKVYVEKVEADNAEPVFLKDGYTDMRGLFDYANQLDIKVKNIKRFAVFIHHPEHGSQTMVFDN